MKNNDRWKGDVYSIEPSALTKEDLDLFYKRYMENGLCFSPVPKIRVIYDLNRKDVHLVRDFGIFLATMTIEDYYKFTGKTPIGE